MSPPADVDLSRVGSRRSPSNPPTLHPVRTPRRPAPGHPTNRTTRAAHAGHHPHPLADRPPGRRVLHGPTAGPPGPPGTDVPPDRLPATLPVPARRAVPRERRERGVGGAAC